jgi:hypothetical protein
MLLLHFPVEEVEARETHAPHQPVTVFEARGHMQLA